MWAQVKLGKEDKGKPCLEKPSPDTNWFIWDGIRGTRANQDYQRELEDTSLLDIENHLAGRRQGKLVKVTSNDASSYNSGGSFLKLEQVWKDQVVESTARLWVVSFCHRIGGIPT